MAEADESWVMAAFFGAGELSHPGPSTVVVDACLFSVRIDCVAPTYGRMRGTRPPIDQDEAQTSVKGGAFHL